MSRFQALLLLLILVAAACSSEGDPEQDVSSPSTDATIEIQPDDSDPSTSTRETISTAEKVELEMPDFDPVELAGREIWRWFYLIDVNLQEETAAQIVDSEYDLVVLDFIPSEQNNTDYPMTELIEDLHEAEHPKLILAYIDIGQAEDFRTYWGSDWEIGDPSWIAGTDPDGWEGNYPVAFWHDDWWDIWLGEDGYLQDILDIGFDGVYLDWVEAYSDETVIALAEEDGVDARQEIIWFVEEIGTFGRETKSEFLLVAQNAAELAADESYRSVIDAIAQEQVWFDGSADDDPPGDCALPETDELIDTAEYRNSLSLPCLEQFLEFPESTLHVSSEGYLRDLHAAQSNGIPILTIDYALEVDNVAWVYHESRAHGFIPFVSNRALDTFRNPTP